MDDKLIIESVTLNEVPGFVNDTYIFSDKNIFVGTNGSRKTTFMKLIYYSLQIILQRMTNSYTYFNKYTQYVVNVIKNGSITIKFKNNNSNHLKYLQQELIVDTIINNMRNNKTFSIHKLKLITNCEFILSSNCLAPIKTLKTLDPFKPFTNENINYARVQINIVHKFVDFEFWNRQWRELNCNATPAARPIIIKIQNILHNNVSTVKNYNSITNVLNKIHFHFRSVFDQLNINNIVDSIFDNDYVNMPQLGKKYVDIVSQLTDLKTTFNTFFQHDKRLYLTDVYHHMAHNIKTKIMRQFKEITDKDIFFTYYDAESCKQVLICDKLTSYTPTLEFRISASMYNLSRGEEEIIYFLIAMENQKSNIVFIDEPCTRASSQNRTKLVKLIEQCNKQMFIITHDEELITLNTCNNLLYFSNVHNNNIKIVNVMDTLFKTELNNDKDKDKTIKDIIEHREIFFANKILCVEGYYDQYFITKMKKFCEKNPEKIDGWKILIDYKIIPMNGKNSNVSFILETLKIHYKVIYDIDALFLMNPKLEQLRKTIKKQKLKPEKKIPTMIDAIKNRQNIKFEHNNKLKLIKILKHDLEEIKKVKHYHNINNFIMKKYINNGKVFVWGTEYEDLEGVMHAIVYNYREYKNDIDLTDYAFMVKNKIISDEILFKLFEAPKNIQIITKIIEFIQKEIIC